MAETPPGLVSTASCSPSASPSPWGPPSPPPGGPCSFLPEPAPAGGGAWRACAKTALGYASRLSKNPHKGPVGGPEEREDAVSFAAKSALLLQGMQQLLQPLQQQQREDGDGIVVHTGAGISTSAGIPDFRGPSGVWTLEKMGQKLADVEASIVQVSFGKQRRPVVPFHLALPTPTHLILQALTQQQQLLLDKQQQQQHHHHHHHHHQEQHQQQEEGEPLACKKDDEHQQQPSLSEVSASSVEPSPRMGGPPGPPGTQAEARGAPGPWSAGVHLIDYIITQNVDALHARCGAPLERLGEVHGNMFIERCDKCARRFLRDFPLPTISFRPTGRLCGLCSFPPSGVCTDVLLDWFDAYEPHFMASALHHSRLSPFHLCLGTSLQIQPACHFPFKERKKGSAISIINLQKTPLDDEAFVCMHAPVDSVLKEIAKGLGLSPGWGWTSSSSSSSSRRGGRWGSMGSCDPKGFEDDPVPFHFGEFMRTALLFVFRLPLHALPPELQQQQQQQEEEQQQQQQQQVKQQEQVKQQKQVKQQQQQEQINEQPQQQLPCGVQGPDDPWAERLAWLPPRAVPTAAATAAAAAAFQQHETLQNGCYAGEPTQTFLVAAACSNALELADSSSSSSSSSSSVAIECLDSLRGIWKVNASRDCTLRLHFWYGSSATLHLQYNPNAAGIEADVWQFMLASTPNTHASSLPPSILPPAAAAKTAETAAAAAKAAETAAAAADNWGCVSCLPSSLVTLAPPYEPRWPQGRNVRRCRLVALLTLRPCPDTATAAAPTPAAAATAANTDTESGPAAVDAAAGSVCTGRGEGENFSGVKECVLPPSLVSLYRLHAAAALPPREALHASLLLQQRPRGPLAQSPASSPLGAPLSPVDGPLTTPLAPPDSTAAPGVCTLENSSSNVERRYPLRRSRQTGAPTPQGPQGPPKRRRGGSSASVLRGASRGPLAAEKVPVLRLPTEEEETRLPYIPLQLADAFQQQQQGPSVQTAAAAPVPCCSSSSCGAPLLLLAADWDLGSLVVAVPPEIKPVKRYARLLQRVSKQQQQQQQETVSDRANRVAKLLLQQLHSSSSSTSTSEGEERGARVIAGAFAWGLLRGLPLWTLHYLQDLLECM